MANSFDGFCTMHVLGAAIIIKDIRKLATFDIYKYGDRKI